MDDYSALKLIESSDPDGGETEPTDADHDAHRAWAIRTFGQRVWNEYAAGGWEPDPEV